MDIYHETISFKITFAKQFGVENLIATMNTRTQAATSEEKVELVSASGVEPHDSIKTKMSLGGGNRKPVSTPVGYKYLSLVTLTLQNALLALSINYSRTRSGLMFTSSTAVLSAEIVKFFLSFGLVFKGYGEIHEPVHHVPTKGFLSILKAKLVDQPLNTLKVAIPAFAYFISNNLLYVAATHLDAATYQVTLQLKILTTAIFSVIILKTKLHTTQWISLVILLIGVILVQLAQTSKKEVVTSVSVSQNRLIGLFAAIGSASLSGFAAVYFECILKDNNFPVSIWMRNVQLAAFSIPIGLVTCYLKDGEIIKEHGFFYGYDAFVVYLIFLQAVGGLMAAGVMKYADNILKCFATSLAIVISCVVSMIFLHFHLTLQFSVGTLLLFVAMILYGHQPEPSRIQRLEDYLNFNVINKCVHKV